MSRLELRLLRFDLQCRLGAILQLALGKKVKFPGVADVIYSDSAIVLSNIL